MSEIKVKYFSKKKSGGDLQNSELDYIEQVFNRTLTKGIKSENAEIVIQPEYLTVKNLVEEGYPFIFVTGGAGTGKTTFIKWMMKEFHGKVLLGAPTAMAALNVGGKTLHSLFKLPPAWIIKSDIKKLSFNSIYREAELLIIDEISMVTANMLDAISVFLRVNRGVELPFAGLPIVVVGDLYQLPPVVNFELKELYGKYYRSPKFISSYALQKIEYCTIELTKTYRQKDNVFIELLSNIRQGMHLEETLKIINQTCTKNNPESGSVWLSPSNATVNERNENELAKLVGEGKQYHAIIKGEFQTDKKDSLPTSIFLKVGAQVMFTQNAPDKSWINGTIGIVHGMPTNKTVKVKLIESGEIVTVGYAVWINYQYFWDEKNSQIERKEIGSFHQIPLMLAWSMTIHKSQGRTLDKVHLDLGTGAFEVGQTYVALSRCRSIEGLSLSKELTINDIKVDLEATEFYKQLEI